MQALSEGGFGASRHDEHKRTFYASIPQDAPYLDSGDVTQREQEAAHYPAGVIKEYLAADSWPCDLPELEAAFVGLGGPMVDAGLLVAGHIGRYLQQRAAQLKGAPLTPRELAALDLHAQLSGSSTHKGRLLHYSAPRCGRSEAGQQDTWCHTHKAISTLTVLVPGMFINQHGEQVPNPDPEAGLYVCGKDGQAHLVHACPGDALVLLGRAGEIQSGGMLHAPPHYVKAPARGPRGLVRSSFAVFMQPPLAQVLAPPPGMAVDDEDWEPNISFGAFAGRSLNLSG